MVIGFDIDVFERQKLENIDEERLKDFVKLNPNTTIAFKSIKEFLIALNDDCVNTDGFWFFHVK